MHRQIITIYLVRTSLDKKEINESAKQASHIIIGLVNKNLKFKPMPIIELTINKIYSIPLDPNNN